MSQQQPAEAATAPVSGRWRAGQAFALLLIWYAFFAHGYLTTNDGSRFALTMAIAETGDLEIGAIYPRIISPGVNPVDLATFEGRSFSDKAPLGALLALPVYRLVRLFTHQLHWLIYAVTVVCSAACGALLGALIVLTLCQWGVAPTRALGLALAIGLGTNLFYWSTVFFGHALTALLLFAAWFVLRCQRHRWWLCAAGTLAAAAFSNEFSSLPAVAVVAGYAIFRHRGRSLWALVGAIPPLLLLGGYDYLLFGDPLVLPYRHQAYFADAHAAGFYGVALPRPIELLRLLAGPKHGLLLYNPLLIAALIATPFFVRRWRSEAWFALGVAAAMWLALSGMDTVRVLGRCWGPRLLLPALPFLALALAALDTGRRWQRWTLYGALALSLPINFAIANTSFLPHQIGWSAWGDLVRTWSDVGSANIVVLTLQPASTGIAVATLLIPLALSALVLLLPRLRARF